MDKAMSLGERRVRVSFNPGDNSLVNTIKQKSAALIDLCEIGEAMSTDESQRLWDLAQTAYEEAAMWAVKAATA